MALTRTCPFCLLPQATECLCDTDEPATPAPQDVPAARCPACVDDGIVCEDHPDKPWEGIHGSVEGHAEHGGVGMPCPACCSPLAEDGTHPIVEAFIPEWRRGGRA